MTTGKRPRVVLIHALRDSLVPAWNAFAAGWPEAVTYNLLDDSLSADLAADGALTDGMVDRFLTLGKYAAATGSRGERTDAILFTCSAFGPAIMRVKERLSIPVLRPNEAAFEAAVDAGSRIGLIVTFRLHCTRSRRNLRPLGTSEERRSRSPRPWLRAPLPPCRLAGATSTTASSRTRRRGCPTWRLSCWASSRSHELRRSLPLWRVGSS